MVTVARWRVAQRYERDFWQGLAQRIAAGAEERLTWYAERGAQLQALLQRLGLGTVVNGRGRVVEVGGGPVGVCGYLPAAVRVAVDPLEEFYSREPALSAIRTGAVQYRAGVGEALPAPDAAFDLAVIENCIDHVRDVEAVMRELHRVLRPGGVLYLAVNCRGAWGYWMHRLLSRLRIDAGHPHSFTVPRLRRLLERHGFRLRSLELTGTQRSTPLRAFLKDLLGVTEFHASAVALREERG